MTDSELKFRWERLERDRAAGNTPEIDYEERTIRREWEEIVTRKRSGELTDPARVNEAKKMLSDACRFLGINVKLIDYEMHATEILDDPHATQSWGIEVGYVGPEDEMSFERWARVAEKMAVEIQSLPYVSVATRYAGNELRDGDLPLYRITYSVDINAWDGPGISKTRNRRR